jgi:4-hydroxybenzoate polyprenyltransferase
MIGGLLHTQEVVGSNPAAPTSGPPTSGLLGLLQATHPVPAISVTLIVGALMLARDAEPAALALGVTSMGAGQASVGWSNDYLDRAADAIAGRREKPIVAGAVSPGVVIGAAALAFGCSVALAVPLGGPATAAIAVAVLSAWLYNLGLKRTLFSWLPYALSFGLVPVFVWLATPANGPPPVWIVAGASLLGVAGHLMNILPDLESDVRFGQRGLPHRLGLRRSLALACFVLASMLALILIAVRIWDDPAMGQLLGAFAAAILIIAVGWSGVTGRLRLGFHLTIAAVASILLVLLLAPEVVQA